MENERKNIILNYIKLNPYKSSSDILKGTGLDISLATLKRDLTELLAAKYIAIEGKGKASRYYISPTYHVHYPTVLEEYFEKEVDERVVNEGYNFYLIGNMAHISLFTKEELKKLADLQSKFVSKISQLPENLYRKDMEMLAIDLSWKSSQIEGNTYSLLETERLLKEKKTAGGKSMDDAIMLLNHKNALDFIFENTDYLENLTVAKIENIHALLVKDLNVDKGIRLRKVGITGTNYVPLDNEFQIREALQKLCHLVNSRDNIFEKALLIILFISYIQPFNDGNKRTARIVSNAQLIAAGYCPLSFRTVDSIDYKMAMILFYEQNNITAFKKIFIEQYEYAVNTYF